MTRGEAPLCTKTNAQQKEHRAVFPESVNRPVTVYLARYDISHDDSAFVWALLARANAGELAEPRVCAWELFHTRYDSLSLLQR